MGGPVTDETARALRRAWFDYLDTVEPVRSKLHAYCLKLTGSVFDAEDLVQEALLRGFGAIGRGDFFNRGSPAVQNARAYLGRIATNLWLDAQRRAGREPLDPDADRPVAAAGEAIITNAAGAALFAIPPQERAAVVLKDVFDFSLAEIASILSTTEGAVKAALHRGRGKLASGRGAATPLRGAAASPELIDRFLAAFNARDAAAIAAVLSETVIYEARGVGGEIGKGAIWIEVNAARPPGVAWERHRFEGEEIAVGVLVREGRRKMLLGVSRLEEAGGLISRHVGYFFAPETLSLVAAALDMAAADHGYHQDPSTLERMIADASLAWRGL
ncbi:MAG TPA: RNA polymerase sigma factor [Caulobacteraceae bacterium]|nr:RNA polymerase sigma factor [Caulobacteraceae bacterium]